MNKIQFFAILFFLTLLLIISFGQNYPNPFNPSTTISFSVNKNDHITLKIYTLSGEEVTTLWNRYTNIGTYYVNFNAENLSSGIYVYKLSSKSISISNKLTLVK